MFLSNSKSVRFSFSKKVIRLTLAVPLLAITLLLPAPPAASPPVFHLESSSALAPMKINLLIDQYSPLLSSVRGFPIQTDEATSGPIEVRTSSGNLYVQYSDSSLTYIDTGIVANLMPGDTIYWSPSLSQENRVGAQIELVSPKESAIVEITPAEDPLFYKATVVGQSK
ncbi:hypothetical protein [Paenibacillus sp. Marseille-Q4541]|uniref:hypothetical protein n=1 Tax=Paenibacillus sp. Marseille-Q4541 TaxID=2831522 RepID=UPI001BACFC91|nr:hypothetical protein [Paenibacillus sp. Marseille-Q4541]